MRDVTFMHTVEEDKQGFKNREIRDAEKARSAYNMVGCPPAADFERMVHGNMLKIAPLAQSLAPTSAPSAAEQ